MYTIYVSIKYKFGDQIIIPMLKTHKNMIFTKFMNTWVLTLSIVYGLADMSNFSSSKNPLTL